MGYGYANNKISKITVNGQTLLSAAIAQPFGPIGAWNWSNGLFTFRDYDSDGRLATWEFRDGVSILRKDQSFDAASRIVGITDPDHPTASQTYQYDALDRLTVGAGPIRSPAPAVRLRHGGQSPEQDGRWGRHQLRAIPAPPTSPSRSPAPPTSYTYDGAGNPTAMADSRTRTTTPTTPGGDQERQHDGGELPGQRVGTAGAENDSGHVTRFVYDEQGTCW
jgi:YD repeat-containing protein